MDAAGGLESSAARQACVHAIRSRVNEHVADWLGDTACMQLALCASTRGGDELLEFVLKPNVAKIAIREAPKVALSQDEWNVLFGFKAIPSKTGHFEKVQRDKTFAQSVERIQNALRCTVGESGQGAMWQRTWTKAACTLALHTESHEEWVASSLGNVVRADLRRLEDLRCTMEDEGMETMMLAEVVQALADCVT
jgi:hypothetical protein